MVTRIFKRLADKYVYDTQQQLLEKLAISSDSLLSLLIGNVITSAVNNHSTPHEDALGVYNHRNKTMLHMHDNIASCSYDEVLWFKRFTTMRKYYDICRHEENARNSDGLGQVIADNIGGELSIPTGRESTHDLATIETNAKESTHVVPDTMYTRLVYRNVIVHLFRDRRWDNPPCL